MPIGDSERCKTKGCKWTAVICLAPVVLVLERDVFHLDSCQSKDNHIMNLTTLRHTLMKRCKATMYADPGNVHCVSSLLLLYTQQGRVIIFTRGKKAGLTQKYGAVTPGGTCISDCVAEGRGKG